MKLYDVDNKYMLKDNRYIIKDDYKIYKNPTFESSNKIYYDSNNSNIYSYGNIVDAVLQSLTPYEIEKLKLLALFAKGQGIQSLNIDDLLSFTRIVTDPQYDSMLRNLGTRINSLDNTKPNPSSVPVTPPIQPIVLEQPQIIKKQPIKKEEEPKRINPIVEKFLSDIRSRQQSGSFRGWMLPNGELLSQYNDTTNAFGSTRQDHAKLYKLFMAGLEKYDIDSFNKINDLYEKFLLDRGVSNRRVYDWDESFAVEALGWMQIATNGGKRILYRGERWQDKLLRPFLHDYGFDFEISNYGDVYYVEFMHLYDNIDEILSLGLEQKYERHY